MPSLWDSVAGDFLKCRGFIARESCLGDGEGEGPGESRGWGQKCLFKALAVSDKKGTMNVVPLAQMKEDKRINSAVHAKVLIKCLACSI